MITWPTGLELDALSGSALDLVVDRLGEFDRAPGRPSGPRPRDPRPEPSMKHATPCTAAPHRAMPSLPADLTRRLAARRRDAAAHANLAAITITGSMSPRCSRTRHPRCHVTGIARAMSPGRHGCRGTRGATAHGRPRSHQGLIDRDRGRSVARESPNACDGHVRAGSFSTRNRPTRTAPEAADRGQVSANPWAISPAKFRGSPDVDRRVRSARVALSQADQAALLAYASQCRPGKEAPVARARVAARYGTMTRRPARPGRPRSTDPISDVDPRAPCSHPMRANG